MACVYILRSKKNRNYYVVRADNFEQRMKQHKEGKVRTTRGLLPVEILLKQECVDVQIAKKAERKIKKLKRRNYIESMIKDGKIKLLEKM